MNAKGTKRSNPNCASGRIQIVSPARIPVAKALLLVEEGERRSPHEANRKRGNRLLASASIGYRCVQKRAMILNHTVCVPHILPMMTAVPAKERIESMGIPEKPNGHAKKDMRGGRNPK
jgi:hypothetical protein